VIDMNIRGQTLGSKAKPVEKATYQY
jgi:hypothetical protein